MDEKNLFCLQNKEFAKITGLTAGNVRQKLSRSLAKMKNNLVQKEVLTYEHKRFGKLQFYFGFIFNGST